MSIAGVDYSTRAVDVVLLDEDTDAATWHRFELREYMSAKPGADAFDRARDVRPSMPTTSFWDNVVACGIEDPRGFNSGALYRVQGAILACLPTSLLVHPLVPSQWRKAAGMSGNASKRDVAAFTVPRLLQHCLAPDEPCWPQDACDAYCIALATRTLLEHGAAA